MRVSVIFARQVVAVIGASRRELLQPLVNVLDQALFGVVDVNGGRDVHRGNQRQSFFNRALGDCAATSSVMLMYSRRFSVWKVKYFV